MWPVFANRMIGEASYTHFLEAWLSFTGHEPAASLFLMHGAVSG